MNITRLEDVTPEKTVISIEDVAAYLSLMYRDTVDMILEYVTIFTDDEMIQEIINTLDLNIICVVKQGVPVGYITPAGVEV